MLATMLIEADQFSGLGNGLKRGFFNPLWGANESDHRAIVILVHVAVKNVDAFDIGDVSLRTTFRVYPNLSNWGRARFDFDADMKWELISDLFFNVGYFHNFDSDPPVDVSNHDYGVTTSVGWSF